MDDHNLDRNTRHLASQGLFDYVSLSTGDVHAKRFFRNIFNLISTIKCENNFSDAEFVDRIEVQLSLGQQGINCYYKSLFLSTCLRLLFISASSGN